MFRLTLSTICQRHECNICLLTSYQAHPTRKVKPAAQSPIIANTAATTVIGTFSILQPMIATFTPTTINTKTVASKIPNTNCIAISSIFEVMYICLYPCIVE
ncbi:unnamed protein product [Orchesella dallaii]|uniref:Uncharacterized protein n=1 Tax=Orchesella dallaii TaxID=48710 RepID=A0ABP1RPD0_9HEXA